MKPRILSTARLSFPLAAAIAALISAQSAQAVDSYWDPALTTTITGTGAGGGIWLSTTANWVTTAGTNVVLPTANRASFGGAAGGVVTVGGPNSAAGMIFNTTGYTLRADSAQTITSTGNVSLASSSVTATIGSNVTVTRASNDIITTVSGTGGVLNIGGADQLSTGARYINTQSGSTGTRTLSITNGTIVNVNSGGYFGQSPDTVYVTATNPNGTAIVIGSASGGSLVVKEGGTVTNGNNQAFILGGAAASGTLTIDGGQVNAGTVTVGTSGSLPAASAYAGLRFGAGSANTSGTRIANLNGGTLTVGQVYAGAGTGMTNTFNFNGGTLQASISNATFMTGANMTANVLANGAKIDSNGFDITIGQSLLAGAPSGGLTKSGGGTLTLSGTNTYTGGTTITGGTLQVTTLAAGGSNSSIGSSGTNAAVGSAATDLVINGGILRYAGTTAATTNRLFTIGTGGATLDASGTTTGTLGFTGTGSLAFSSSAAPASLTLTGTGTGTAGAGSLASVIGNSGSGANITSLNKTSSGTWTLTGLNTYTGATTISGGTLKLSGTGKLGYTSGTTGTYAGAMSIASGAIFENASSGSQTLSGAITGGGTLTNSGGGGLLLTNADNSFAALSISNAGSRVFINHATALPAAATVNIASGALVFAVPATNANAITVASGGTLTARAATTLSNVTLPGSGSVIFNNDDANTQLLTISNDQTLTGDLTVQIGGSRMIATTSSLGAVTLSGKLSGVGGLVVASSGNFANNPTLFGTGVLTLSGANDYTGATTVTTGKLVVDGSTAAGSAVSVGSGGTLGGTGTIGGTLALTGVLAPGDAGVVDIETLNAGSTTWNGGSIWNFDLSSSNNTSDQLAITGNLTKGSGSGFAFNFMGSQPVWNTAYTLATWTGTTDFALGDFSFTNLGAGSYDASSFSFSGNSLVFTAVPEPTSALAGLLIAAGLLRRRRSA